MKLVHAVFCLIALLGLSTVKAALHESVKNPCKWSCRVEYLKMSRDCERFAKKVEDNAKYRACLEPFINAQEKCVEACPAKKNLSQKH